MNNRRGLLFLYLSAFIIFNFKAHSQDDLIKEIDALNQFPEDDDKKDSSNMPSSPTASNAGSADSNSLDSLPVEDTPADEPPVLGQENILQGAPTALSAIQDSSSADLRNMNFKQMGDRVRLVLDSSRALDFKQEARKQRKQIVVEFENAKIARTFVKRALDTSEFDGPVALVQAFDSKSSNNNQSVKVLIQLRDFIEPTFSRSGNSLYVDFPILMKDGVLFKSHVTQGPKPELFLTIDDTTKYSGSRINLNVKDAPLPDVLNFLSKASGQNFVLAEGSTTKVTMNVRNTPWDQVLSLILMNAQLGYQKVGNTFRIAKITTLRSEIEEAAKSKENEKKLEALETRLFTLSYLNAKTAQASIEKFLKDPTRENATTDERTNSLVVTGLNENVERIARFLSSIDRQTPQVQIDARIVETSEGLDRKFKYSLNLHGLNFKKYRTEMLSNGGSASGTFTDARYGRISGGIDLFDAFINASEVETKTKVIAAPRVVVSNNQKANLSQGQEELILVADRDGAQQTKTYEYTLDLNVTPQVTNDGFVLLDINLKRDTKNTQIGSEQAKDKRGVVTKMLVKSGETAVIGGLYIDDSTTTKVGIPFLRDIPILGFLFDNENNRDKKRKELMMFISPRILNEGAALIRASTSNVPSTNL